MIALVDGRIEAYAAAHTSEEPELLRRLVEETHREMNSPEMLTGRVEGTLLRLLVRMSGARRVLEVGMFTGYSALMMASGLPDDGRLITCDVDPSAERIARRYFAESPHGSKIEIRMGAAADTLRSLNGPFDFCFIDADKQSYPHYLERCVELLRPGGVLAADNTLWSGKVLEPADDASRGIVEFNRRVHADPRLDHALLTVRDGLILAVKR